MCATDFIIVSRQSAWQAKQKQAQCQMFFMLLSPPRWGCSGCIPTWRVSESTSWCRTRLPVPLAGGGLTSVNYARIPEGCTSNFQLELSQNNVQIFGTRTSTFWHRFQKRSLPIYNQWPKTHVESMEAAQGKCLSQLLQLCFPPKVTICMCACAPSSPDMKLSLPRLTQM